MNTIPDLLIFKIDGSLPSTWEDFYSQDVRYPHITLQTRALAESEYGEADEGSLEDNDGFLTRTLDVEMIDEDSARQAISQVMGVPVAQISIMQLKWAQAV